MVFKPNKHRKFINFFLDVPFQMRFGLKLAAAGITLGVLNIFVFNWYMRENYEYFLDPLLEAGLLDDEVASFLYQKLTSINWILFFITLILAGFCTFMGFFLSHNIIGPVYAMKRTLNKIIEGDEKARVVLRPGDEFQNVASSFNQMMDHLEDKANFHEDT